MTHSAASSHHGDHAWEHLLPPTKGTLPNGAPMPRTDPSGSPLARIVILGAYPAATLVRRLVVGATPMMLPMAVERTSFEPSSKSGAELDAHYLAPLGLTVADVLITDLMPYFLANTTKSSSGRSMADNLRLFERHSGTTTGIAARPEPNELVQLARAMPGNTDRLRFYLARCAPRLLLTLGAEPAAFVRGETHDAVAARFDALSYAAPETRDVLGVAVDVVHLVHPHLFIKKNAKWMARHRAWCAEAGRTLVEHAR